MNQPPSPASPWRLQVFESLPSTSDLCRTLAEAGEPAHLAILARRQTQGRGTQGRLWTSPPGNLFLSALLRPHERMRDVGQWALLAAVAVADAVAGLLPDPAALRLKWPNDLLLGDAKLAGILTEASADPAGNLAWLVIGMGVNVATAPALADRVTVSLAQVTASPPDPLTLARAVLDRLLHWQQARLVAGFAAIRAAWVARGPALGALLTLRQGGRAFAGHFAGLGDDGSLLLATGGRVHAFAAGEV